jgi:hypothetical protein
VSPPETTAPALQRPHWRLSAPPRDAAVAVVVFVLLAVLSAVLVGELDGDGRVVCACLLGIAVAMVALPPDRIVAGFGLAILVWFAAIGLALVLPKVYNPEPSVTDAVGLAAYWDTPYRGQQLAVVLALALLLGVPALAMLRSRLALRRLGPAPAAWASAPVARPARRTLLALAGGTLLIALTLLPDIHDAVLRYSPFPASGHGWDRANLITWNWLEQRGALPVRDFFFPYGGTWTFSVYPLGPVWNWLYELVVLGLFAWPLWRLSGGRAVRVIACLGVLVILAAWSSGVWRYGPALPVALCYAALGPGRHQRLTAGHAVLGLACLVAAFTGPDIFGVYAMAGVAVVLFGDWLRAPRPWRQWVRGLALDAIPFAVAAVALVGSWIATDSVDGNVRLWFGLDKAAAGYAIDQVHLGALANVGFGPTLAAVTIAIPFLTIAGGLAQTLWNRGRDRGTAPLLLAAGAIGFATLMKVMVRPVGLQLLLVPLLALVWTPILLVSRRALRTVAVSGVLLGAAFAVVQADGSFDRYADSIANVPGNVVHSVSLAGERDQIADVGDKRFGPARFRYWPETQLAAAVKAAAGGRVPRLATLGDFPVLYILLNQPPPYHIDFYDASQIAEQKAMLAALRRKDPEVLVWNQTPGDQVPYWVRNPLIFTWAVARYGPVSDAPLSAYILARRKPRQPIAYDWWRSHFPNPLDLGYVPALSDGADQPACTSGPGCAPYAFLRGHPGKKGEPLFVAVRGRGGTYPVRMSAVPGTDVYAIRLDRLWFWPIIGPHPRITSGSPGYTVQMRRVRAGDRLY